MWIHSHALGHAHKYLGATIGKWLGLRQTWGADCMYDNDGIADTPTHIVTGSNRCDLDTCPNLPGKDPTSNLMGEFSHFFLSLFSRIGLGLELCLT